MLVGVVVSSEENHMMSYSGMQPFIHNIDWFGMYLWTLKFNIKEVAEGQISWSESNMKKKRKKNLDTELRAISQILPLHHKSNNDLKKNCKLK